MNEQSYLDKVFAALLKMEVGTQLVMARKVAPENFEKFRDAVRLAIDLNWCGPEFYFEFDNLYTEVRKRKA